MVRLGVVEDMRELQATPHVGGNDANRSPMIDGGITHHLGYAANQAYRLTSRRTL